MYGCSGDSYSAGTVQGFTAQTNCLNNGLVIQGTTIRVPYDKQVPGLPAQPGAGGGYMTPSLVSQAWNAFSGALKGLMTWSINWDGVEGLDLRRQRQGPAGSLTGTTRGVPRLPEWHPRLASAARPDRTVRSGAVRAEHADDSPGYPRQLGFPVSLPRSFPAESDRSGLTNEDLFAMQRPLRWIASIICSAAAIFLVVSVTPNAQAADQRSVTYLRHRFTVPRGWQVVDLSANPRACVRFDRHALYLGTPSPDQDCPARAIGRSEAVLVQPAGGAGTSGTADDPVAQQITAGAAGVTVTATYDRDRGTAEKSCGRPGSALPRPRHPARRLPGPRLLRPPVVSRPGPLR